MAGWMVVAVAAVLAAGVGPAPGSLDPSWGGDGAVDLDLGTDQWAEDVAATPAGGVVVAGFERDVGGFLVRFRRDGRLDRTFGGDGVVTERLDDHATRFYAVAALGDGSVVAAAGLEPPTTPGTDVTVVRYRPDGTPDPAFGGGDGWTTVEVDRFSVVEAVAVQGDGRVVAVTSSFGAPSLAVRFTATGAPDATFGAGGVLELPVDALDVLAASDGRIVVAGDVDGDAALLALADGAPDPAFGDGGVATVDVHGLTDRFLAVAEHGGRFLATGSAGANTDGGRDLVVAAFDGAGAVDPGFGGDGVVTEPLGGGFDDKGEDVAVQPDGRVVVLAYDDHRFDDAPALLRFRPGGRLDRTFGGTGIVRFAEAYHGFQAVALTPSGAVTAGADTQDGIHVVRVVL